jgi:hypothetical protein
MRFDTLWSRSVCNILKRPCLVPAFNDILIAGNCFTNFILKGGSSISRSGKKFNISGRRQGDRKISVTWLRSQIRKVK